MMWLGFFIIGLVSLTFDLLDLSTDMLNAAALSLLSGAFVGILVRVVVARMDDRRSQAQVRPWWSAWLVVSVLFAVIVVRFLAGQARFMIYGVLLGFLLALALRELVPRRN